MHPESLPPVNEPSDGVEISRDTAQLLAIARVYSNRYNLAEALGVTSPLDLNVIDISVARKLAREEIRARRRSAPVHEIDAILARVESDLDRATAIAREQYPAGSSRADRIRNGVVTIFSQLETTPRGGFWDRKARGRRTAYEAAETWRNLLREEKGKRGQ